MSENPTIEEEKQKTKNKTPPPKKQQNKHLPQIQRKPVETSIPHANIFMSTCFPGLVQSLQ
jgi:hypothetical protein